MGYTRVTGVWSNIMPHRWTYLWVVIPAGARRRDGRRSAATGPRIVLAVAIVAAVAGFQWLPAGFVYNGRWLPFYFLFTALLAAYGVGEALPPRWALAAARRLAGTGGHQSVGDARRCILAGCVVGGIALPGFRRRSSDQVPGWVSWNYTGFQGKSGWPVYQGIVRMLDQAGRTYGCGRLQYEYITETTDPFGSTEATMALPYWTDGCMDTIDGVLFESSTTTPFHFLDQAEYSLPGESSNPVSFLTYPSFNLADGIRHLQFEDVRYFLAVSPQVEAAAKSVPGLVKIASTPGFPGPIDSVTADPSQSGTSTSSKAPSSSPPSTICPRSNPARPPTSGWTRTLPGGRTRATGPSSWPSTGRRTGPGQPSGPSSLPRGRSRSSRRPSAHVAVDERDGQLRRRPPRLARARESALLPQLARQRGPWALRGVAQSHGSRADGTSRDAHLRNDAGRPDRQARLARRRRRPGHAHDTAPTGHVRRRRPPEPVRASSDENDEEGAAPAEDEDGARSALWPSRRSRPPSLERLTVTRASRRT